MGVEPYREKLEQVQTKLNDTSLIVGFNLKFDLAWLWRYGLKFDHCRVFDLQLAEFILTNQTVAYPSLDTTLAKYKLEPKSKFIEEQYWSKGIDTVNIPEMDIVEYLHTDLIVEDQLFQHYIKIFPKEKEALLRLQNQDLLCLLEMEINGIKFDLDGLSKRSEQLTKEITEAKEQLNSYIDNWPHFNWNSGDHISCLLYGGTITVKVPEEYEHTYKSGKKAGLTEKRNRWVLETKEFPRLVAPLEGTELKKHGFYETNESTLLKLPKHKKLVALLVKLSEREKLQSTYYTGIVKTMEKMDWQDRIVHGQFNQCRAITGRLSSSNPNQQNFPEELGEYIVSRFS